jgi:hypothetical protein
MIRASLGQWLVGWARGVLQAVPTGGSSLILALTASLFFLVGIGIYTQWAER